MTQLRPPDAGRQQPLGSWALATTLITLLVLLVGALMLQPKLMQRRLNIDDRDVLTADEVAAEYALGRTGKALSVTDTAVCLGGTVPRAQLDVRGSARFDGHLNVSVSYTHLTLPTNREV